MSLLRTSTLSATMPNKPMQTDGRFAVAADRQGVRLTQGDEYGEATLADHRRRGCHEER
jgi:hypothetical protein